MAAKGKSATVKKAKATKTAVAKSKTPKFSPRQWTAYHAAAKAAIHKAQFNANVAALQRRRLQGAAKATAKAKKEKQLAVRLRIGRNAARQTWRQNVAGHQSRQLRQQSAHHLFRVQSVATRHQFAYRGQAIHAHVTRMQTIDRAQAIAQEKSLMAAARRRALARTASGIAKKSSSSKAKGRPSGKVSKPARFSAIGRAAGLKAARATPPGPKVTKKTKARKAATMLPHAQNWESDWIVAGNDAGVKNCLAVAFANHLFAWTGVLAEDKYVEELHEALGSASTIADGLRYLKTHSLKDMRVRSCIPLMKCVDGSLIGYMSEKGPHASVLLEGRQVIEWGHVVTLRRNVEESWFIEWVRTDDHR